MLLPDPPPLREGALHVWSADVDEMLSAVERIGACLSRDELVRARIRRSELDRARYVTTRGILRRILAAYAGENPAYLPIRYGPQGKPVLAGDAAPISFNVTHSGPLAMFAVSRAAAVGIDLERVRPLLRAERVARRIFSPEDLASWRTMGEQARLDGFFDRWTRAEAIAKLHGGGVWWLSRHRAEAGGGPDISVVDVTAPHGYRAAAAVAGPLDQVAELRVPVDLNPGLSEDHPE